MVVVSMVAAVSTGEAFVVANSVQCEADTCSAAAVSTGLAFVVAVSAMAFVVAVLVAVITDSIMMSSSSTTSAFRGGGPGAIRTDITVPTITRTVTKATRLWMPLWQPIRAFSEFAEAVTSVRATAFRIHLAARAF